MANPTSPNPVFLQGKFGINENSTPLWDECSDGYNFDLSTDSDFFQCRKPFDINSTAPNAGAITGIMQLNTRANVKTTLVCAGTKVYLWDGAASWTNTIGPASAAVTVPSGSLLRDSYWSLGDYLVITDISKQNVVKKWDGTVFGDLTTGLGGTALYAKYGIVYQHRMWLFNVTAGSDTPHLLVASALEDPTSYDTSKRGGPVTVGGASFSTGTEAFYLTTPDLKSINGVSVFMNTLIISTENGRLFQLVGSSAKDFQFVDFYDGSAAIGNESIANIGNDVVFVRQGGQINLLSATQELGNSRTDSMSRWFVQTTNNLTGCTAIIYDSTNQKIYFFVPGKVLVFFKDFLVRGGWNLMSMPSPWSVYKTQHPNGFNTQAVKYMLEPDINSDDYTVYFGDAFGNMFDLNGEGEQDADVYPVQFFRKTRILDSEVFNAMKRPYPYMRKCISGRVQYRRSAPIQLNLTALWADEYNSEVCTIQLKGPPANDVGAYFNQDAPIGSSTWGYSDSLYFNQGFNASGNISTYEFSIAGKGSGVFLSMNADAQRAPFTIDHIELD